MKSIKSVNRLDEEVKDDDDFYDLILQILFVMRIIVTIIKYRKQQEILTFFIVDINTYKPCNNCI